MDPATTQDWPGQRLGLPRDGSSSVGRLGRRVVAVLIDWLASSLVSAAFFAHDPWATLGVFTAEQVLLVGTLGASFGHALAGLRVRRLVPHGRSAAPEALPGPRAALVRAVLLAVVIPATVYDADQRGLHDRAAGTVLLRR